MTWHVNRWMVAAGIAALCVLAAGCGGTKVTNVDPTTEAYLSGRWNDSDAQSVAKEMVPDCLARPWLDDFLMAQGAKPRVIVGQVVNEANEHINTDVFIKELERELTNSGKVRFVADESLRSSLMAEVDWQSKMARDGGVSHDVESGVSGADFMMVGTISSIVDQSGSSAIVFYQVDLQLIDLRNWEKVWYGTTRRKHMVEGSKVRF